VLQYTFLYVEGSGNLSYATHMLIPNNSGIIKYSDPRHEYSILLVSYVY
jgi:hypothetical protein